MNWEPFYWPNILILKKILFLAMLDCTCFFSLLLGTIFTNPILMATGSLLVVPVSFAIDIIIDHQSINVGCIIGVILICLGFIIMELPFIQYLRKLNILRTFKKIFL